MLDAKLLNCESIAMNTLRAFYALLGALLLSAALIKLRSLLMPEVLSTVNKPANFFALSWIVIVIEVAVGCFNILRKPDRWTRKINLIMFGVFCCWLGYLTITGVSRCGCLGNLDVESRSMLALDFLIVISIVLLGADGESKAINDRFVILLPLILVAAAWALAPSVSEKFRQQVMAVNDVTASIVSDPMLEIDPLNGFDESIQVVVQNNRPEKVLIASTHCDWCVPMCRISEGSIVLEPGQTRRINIQLFHPSPLDEQERAIKQAEARNGLQASKVPELISVRLSLLPKQGTVEPIVSVRCRPTQSYAGLWGADR